MKKWYLAGLLVALSGCSYFQPGGPGAGANTALYLWHPAANGEAG